LVFIIAGLAGALAAWSFTPNHWWAAILAVALMLNLLSSLKRKSRMRVTAVFALVFFGFHVQWINVLGVDAWIALTFLCSLPWLLLAVFNLDSTKPWFYLVPAAAVVAIETIRGTIPWGGFSWGLLAYSQLDGPLVNLATLGGQGLVSGAVVACAAAIVKLLKQRNLSALFVIVLLLLVSRGVDIMHSTQTVTLAAIQGNVPRVGNELSTQRAAVLNNHLEVTQQLLTDIADNKVAQPDLIVWPESGTDIDPLQPGLAVDEITDLVSATDIPVLIGATTWGSGDASKSSGPRNAGILWQRDSGPGEMYFKNHLVPFGEYIPLRDFIARFISRFDQIPSDFIAGTEPGIFRVENSKIGDVICFEVAYADRIQKTVAAGAQVMVVQTNNATYGNTSQPAQQFAITRFRAIESQRAFLVASTSGISGLIRNDGTVIAQTKQFEAATVVGEVELISDLTFTHRFPHWVLVVSILILTFALRRNRVQ
jgi:apolipoprotein N-acyltransferase